jgi:photosystem II stability/assembly factor-like uncharacterized protein
VHTLRAIATAMLLAPASSPLVAQWTWVASGTTAELRGLSVAGGVAWASGTRGTVVRSTDGGITWKADSIPGAAHLDFRAIHAIDANTAFLASAGEAEKGLAKIYATRDGGRSWNIVYSTDEKGVFFDDIKFWDARRGLALSDPVGGAFVLMVTSDSGRSWTRLPPERQPRNLEGEAAFAASAGSMSLPAPGVIRIGTGGGGRARVMGSDDWGSTWRVADAPVHADGGAAGIFAVDFLDANRGVAVGGDYTKPRLAATSSATTADGGKTWSVAQRPAAAYLSSIAIDRTEPRGRVMAVGLAGRFVSGDMGLTWAQVDTIAMNTIRESRGIWIAVGPRGRIVRSDKAP